MVNNVDIFRFESNVGIKYYKFSWEISFKERKEIIGLEIENEETFE